MEEIEVIDIAIDKDEEKRIFTDLGKIDGLQQYLSLLMGRDIRLHFNCPKDQQDLARGAYYRMEWLSKKIRQHSLDNK